MPLQVKARYLILAFLPYLIFYFLIQSLIGTSQYNLLMGIDEKIPFVPPFIWIYHTTIPVIILTAIFLFQKRDIFLGLIFSFIFAGIVMCLFYIFTLSITPHCGACINPEVGTCTNIWGIILFKQSKKVNIHIKVHAHYIDIYLGVK